MCIHIHIRAVLPIIAIELDLVSQAAFLLKLHCNAIPAELLIHLAFNDIHDCLVAVVPDADLLCLCGLLLTSFVFSSIFLGLRPVPA